ncbi:cysteine--tRNA ligase [Alphaproteobacteria bacterium]|nr:cysteine--tRNA ligase [Alphaproteobacteria bacterium]
MNYQITLFNTINNQKEQIITCQKDIIKMYVCGPTVYDRAHIGNARSVVVYDLLYRLLLQLYPQVIYVRNITDVDDKINTRAKEQKISIKELTTKVTELFHNDVKELNTLMPTFEPKVTEHIAEIIELIKKLLENKNAYVSEKHVLFDVSSYPNYGKLSKRNIDNMIAGARVEVADYKKNPLDFVLWKPADFDDDPSSVFESPWGMGRPGWHIECSAMSSKYLGCDFDIHGGGADLQFPHHENEIAQSCCAYPESNYAKYWVHNGFVTVNGEKMSKTLKNFITIHDLLELGKSGIAIRLMLLTTHYRKPFDYNDKALSDAEKTIQKFNKIVNETLTIFNNLNLQSFIEKSSIAPEVIFALADDLNFSKTLACLHEIVKEIKIDQNSLDLRKKFISTLDFLGLI